MRPAPPVKGTAQTLSGGRLSEWETLGAAGPGPQLSWKLCQGALGAASCVSRLAMGDAGSWICA